MQMKSRITAAHVLTVFSLALASIPALAGPPFLTDDPEPVDLKHSEFYVFSTYDKTPDGKEIAIPAFEYNYGLLPNTQLHVMVPFARGEPTGEPSRSGLGDIEVGVKYRFLEETETTPQVGIFPMAELNTGDSAKGLGNGKTWWRLPVWAQKSWGKWTTYGGAGYVINRAEGKKNYPFAGWLLQKEISEKWTLGGEVFARSKDSEDGRATTLVNLGGYYKIKPDLNLLFSAGHSVGGEKHTLAYVGLLWSFGGDEKEGTKTGMAAASPTHWASSLR